MLKPGSVIRGSGTDSSNAVRLRWVAKLSVEPTTGAQGWDVAATMDNRKIRTGVVLAHDATEPQIVRRIAEALQEELKT